MRRLRPEELLLGVCAVTLAIVLAVTGTTRPSAFLHPRFFECVAGLALVVIARSWWKTRRVGTALFAAARVLRDFAPFLGVLVLYECLHDLTPLVRPRVVDATLLAIDRALLGVDVASFLDQFASPWLTRVMVWCYASYFLAPGLLACALYAFATRRAFRDFLLSLIAATLIGYVGYLLVPAVGPYVFEADKFTSRLPGGGKETHLFIRAIDDLRGVARDCFPSLHTAHTTVVLVFAWRWKRWLALAYAPIALGLFVSTMYLRMHYAIDVAAGFATAALACWVGPRLDRMWSLWSLGRAEDGAGRAEVDARVVDSQ